MADIKKIVEEVKSMTVVELNDLVKAIEEEFGVSAAAMAVAAPAAGAGAAYGGEVLANKAGDAIVKKIAGKRGPNGRFVKLTKTEKTLRDVGASMRDTKTVQNLAKKAGKALKIVK